MRILMIGYLPPPYFGPSVAYQALMRSEFTRRFDVTFLDISVAQDITELEILRAGKLARMLRFLAHEVWYLMTQRFDFCCCPISVNRNAFLKDALLLGLARGFGVRTVLFAHGNNLPDFRARSPRWLQRLIDCTIRGSAAAIVLGERLRFNFQQHLPDERIFVVPLGIEPALPKSVDRPPATAPTVLFLSNLIREKGVLVLLRAIPAVLQHRPETQFVFAGAWYSEPDRREAERQIRENKLAANVEFIGPVTGLAKWQALTGAAMFVFPTFYYYETMGLVLLEAMQAGLPVVTTRRGSIQEIIEDGINGLLVEEQDAGDLAEKILRLVGDPALRRRMGAANREKFTNYYTYEHYGRRMIAVFERLAGHA